MIKYLRHARKKLSSTKRFLLSPMIFILSFGGLIGCNPDYLDIWYEVSAEGPYCEGDEIFIKVGGIWLGGGISANVVDNLTASSSLDYDFETINENFFKEGVRVKLDSDKGNSITFHYYFEIEENQYDEGCSVTISKTINFEILNAVEPMDENQFTAVYPNPGNGIVNFLCRNIDRSKKIKINVISQSGQLVFSQEVDDSNEWISLDLTDLPSGIYFIAAFNYGTRISYSKYVKL